MSVFINGIGMVSAQTMDEVWQEPISSPFLCKEPDYTSLIPPMQLRRMSKAVRMGIASALTAVKEAKLEKPDIISIGTSYGCLADTEFFLKKLVEQEEQMLTPTAFIQSTHNTVSGQIALIMGCHGQNFTFTQRAHSFEHAMQDALMSLAENPQKQILVGGIDEMTEHSRKIIARFGTYKDKDESFFYPSEGSIPGEGSTMFILSGSKVEHSYAEVLDVETCWQNQAVDVLDELLRRNQLIPSDIQTVLLGVNGDSRYKECLSPFVAKYPHASMYSFKQFCGEYPTSTAFAMMMACNLYRGRLNAIPKWPSGSEAMTYSLIINHYKNQYYSFVLLKAI